MPPKQLSSAGRFLIWASAMALALLALGWAYVICAPMAFLESGYPALMAKQKMLDSCDLGVLTVFGDSRAEAGIVPRLLSIKTTNFSFGAETPIEAYHFVKRALKCKHLPNGIIITFNRYDFSVVYKYFWENYAMWGFLHYHDLAEMDRISANLQDFSIEKADPREISLSNIRNAVYSLRVPPIFIDSLINGRIFERYSNNVAILRDRLRMVVAASTAVIQARDVDPREPWPDGRYRAQDQALPD